MHGGPYAYASHYALSGIRKLGACTSLASPNASHYAARRTPPPSKINRKRQYIHVIIACVTVRWPCGCLIRTTCHVYGLWISAGAPRPVGGRGVFDVSRIRITHTSFSPQSFARGTVQWPARRVPYVPRLTFPDYVSRPARPRAPPPPPPPPPLRITHTHYALGIFLFVLAKTDDCLANVQATRSLVLKSNTNPNCQTCESTCVA